MEGIKKRLRGVLSLEFVVRYRVFFILAALCVIVSIIQPIFLNPRNLINVLRQVSASAVLAAGFTLVLGSGNIDLSVGTQIGMNGVFMAMASKIEGMPFIGVIGVGIVVAVICGVINAFFINTFTLPPFIVTLATMSIHKGICYIVSNTTPVSSIADYITNFAQGNVLGIPKLVVTMIIVYILMYIIINKSIFGRHAIAMGGNYEAARVSGINTSLIRYGVYICMSLCAFMSALMMTGRAASAQPVAGQGMEMDAIAAVVIGGTPMSGGNAKIGGTILGCLIVGVIANALNLISVDSNFQLIVKGVLILIAIVLDAESAKFFAKRSK